MPSWTRRTGVALALAAPLLGIHLWASFALPGGADVRRYSSGIFDADVARVVVDLTTGRPALRASVHPLQKLLVAPLGAGLNDLLFGGRDRLGAARVLIALAMTLNALGVAVLARQLTGSAAAGAAAALVSATSFASLLAATVPESAALASLALLLPLLLLNARWGRPLGWGEAAAWGLLAVLGIGLTLTQIAHWAVALGVRVTLARGPQRPPPERLLAAAVGAVLLVCAGALAQERATGTEPFWTRDPIAGERPWMRSDDLRAAPLRHVARVAAQLAVLDFAAPFPAPSDFLLRGGLDYWSLSIEEAGPERFAPAQRVLMGVVLLAVLGGAAGAVRGDARLLAPALCVASQLGLHLLYGRELVLYAPHWHGALVALLVAGAWRGLGARRRWLPAGAALLAAALLANNLIVLRAAFREVEAGLDADRRDAHGALLPNR